MCDLCSLSQMTKGVLCLNVDDMLSFPEFDHFFLGLFQQRNEMSHNKEYMGMS